MNKYAPNGLMSLNVWPKGTVSIRRYGVVGVGMRTQEEAHPNLVALHLQTWGYEKWLPWAFLETGI